jgi:hypothetical protein
LLGDRLQASAQNLEFDHDALDGAVQAPGLLERLLDEQIGASAAQPVFPVDPPVAIDDALQERLHEQLEDEITLLGDQLADFGPVEAGERVEFSGWMGSASLKKRSMMDFLGVTRRGQGYHRYTAAYAGLSPPARSRCVKSNNEVRCDRID